MTGRKPKDFYSSIQFTRPFKEEIKRKKRKGESYEEYFRRLFGL